MHTNSYPLFARIVHRSRDNAVFFKVMTGDVFVTTCPKLKDVIAGEIWLIHVFPARARPPSLPYTDRIFTGNRHFLAGWIESAKISKEC